jgi:hypothetical protein
MKLLGKKFFDANRALKTSNVLSQVVNSHTCNYLCRNEANFSRNYFTDNAVTVRYYFTPGELV